MLKHFAINHVDYLPLLPLKKYMFSNGSVRFILINTLKKKLRIIKT